MLSNILSFIRGQKEEGEETQGEKENHHLSHHGGVNQTAEFQQSVQMSFKSF